MWAKLNAHPRDAAIKFYEKDHIYTIEGGNCRPISVTTIIKKNFPEFEEKAIIDKYYNKWQSDCSHKYFKMTKEEIVKCWEDNRIEASRLGTEMHKAIEQYLNKELEEEPQPLEFGYFKRFWGEILTSKPDYKIYRTEWTIYNQKKTVAGSIDALLETGTGELIMLDWKRSKLINVQTGFGKVGLGPFSRLVDCNYTHYAIQLNCYKRIIETCYCKKVKKMFFVVFHPDNGSYIIYEVPDLQELVAPLID